MKRDLIHFLLMAMLLLASPAAFAQFSVKGQLVDDETGEPLVGAAVMVEGTSTGTVTDIDGFFQQSVAKGGKLVFKYVGYKEQSQKVNKGGDLGVIRMEVDAVMLKDVVISSSIAVARKTPVAAFTVDPIMIEDKLGSQELPQILKSTPGVYVSNDGGGFGDSNIKIRGFKSQYVAMMINGVPMNGMENQKVYMSNWSGLSDVASSIQVQRGLGASKVSSPSIGGSQNIITKTTDAKKGGFISYAMGNDGYQKMMFSVSSGLTKDGWAFTILGSKDQRDGYIQGTESEGYSWFISLAKRINDNHQLSLTAFGAPQWHNQRNSANGLSIKEYQRVAKTYYMEGMSAYRYNSTYGYRNGEVYNSSRNEYHKPQISLNHLWQINHKSSLSTAVYMSIGTGAGFSGTGVTGYNSSWYGTANDGTVNTEFRRGDGTFDYDAVEALNRAQSTDAGVDVSGMPNYKGSLMIMNKASNDHFWTGLISTYTTELGEDFDFYGGIDFRYYKGLHQNVITDLFGGDYYVDSYNRSGVLAANHVNGGNSDFVNEKLGVGDVIRRDYDGYVVYEGAFSQLEYNKDKINAFVSGGLSNTSYWRYDRFYYSGDNRESSKKHYLGGNVKGGMNYNLTDHHNVFFNAGFISMAPIFENTFINSQSSHERNNDAKNEKVYSFELGYGYKSRFFSANLNAYYTRWNDKALYDSGSYETELGTTERWTMNMAGAGARHMGVELDFIAKPVRWLELTGMFSYGDWRWDGEATGYMLNTQGQIIADTRGTIVTDMANVEQYKYTIQMDNVHVGGSAQMTSALGLTLRPLKGVRLSADWNFFANNYADYDIDASTATQGKPYVVADPWKMPSWSTFDVSAGYTFDFGKIRASLSGNVNNLFNQEYIADARDGSTHDWDSATRVLYGFGRTYSVRLKLNF